MRSRTPLCALLTTLVLAVVGAPAHAASPPTPQPTAVGRGGAVATDSVYATRAAIYVLRHGGNAVDAAVTANAVLGLTEPFVAGIGGGGFMNVYVARRDRVTTLDGRETAPASTRPDHFIDPATGLPLPFADAVTSGLSVGIPGTLATWAEALRRYGTISLARALRPAINLARAGFVVNQDFHDTANANAARFRDFPATRALFLAADGSAPAVGSVFRNPDLAATYARIARHGIRAFYGGKLSAGLVDTVNHPPVDPASTRLARPGSMTVDDLAGYQVKVRRPTLTSYRGLDVYGMAPPSSGGSTGAEILNILEGYDLGSLPRADAWHRYLAASALAYADRGHYVGDPAFFDVPLAGLVSKEFAAARRALLDPTHALAEPVAPGDPYAYQSTLPDAGAAVAGDEPGTHTNHLSVIDRWGNVVSYTSTIEQLGGSAMTVPGQGYLLNNELTDFDFVPPGPFDDPNLPDAGKRPRSSMSPTIVLRDGHPWEALGSPGGSTIITTVVQTLLYQVDLGLDLPAAVAAPRASDRNSGRVDAEPAFLADPAAASLQALGYVFNPVPELGEVNAVQALPDGRLQAVSEPVRSGGGSAMVVRP